MPSPLRRRTFLRTAAAGAVATPLLTGTSRGGSVNGPGIAWHRRLDLGGHEEFRASAPAHGGGVLLAGWRFQGEHARDGSRPIVAVVDDGGLIQTTRALDAPGGRADAVVGTADGGYFVGDGATASFHKLDADLTVAWSKRFQGGTQSGTTHVADFASGSTVAAWSEPPGPEQPEGRGHLVALAGDGAVEWHRKRPTTATRSLLPDGDGVVRFVETHDSDDGYGSFLERLTADGTVDWRSTVEPAETVARTEDGGYVFAGKDFETDGLFLEKRDAGRGRAWRRSYAVEAAQAWDWRSESGPDLENVTVHDVAQAADGGYVLAGTGRRAGGTVDAGDTTLLLKASADGELEWRVAYAAPETWYGARTVRAAGPDRYLLAGTTPGDESGLDGWVAHVDESLSRKLTPTVETTTTARTATTAARTARPARTTTTTTESLFGTTDPERSTTGTNESGATETATAGSGTTETSLSGFTAVGALGGLAGGAVLSRLRGDRSGD